MASINSVALIGRLVRDIELKTTESGKTVSSFVLAVDGYSKDSDANFIDCVAWGKAAEILQQYTSKGKQIGITGRLQTRIWERDNIKRKITEIVVDQFQLLGSKSSDSDESQSTPAAKPTPAQKQVIESTVGTLPEQDEIDLSDIPF